MPHHEYTWHTEDGLRLFGQAWTPNDPASAVVCLIHGLGEHSGRYAAIAEALTAADIACLACDLRGHGYSEGVRGHAGAYERLLDDIDLLLDVASTLFPGVPRFTYGHSLGGNLVLVHGLRRRPRLAGVVAVGPALRMVNAVPVWKLGAAILFYHLWPSFQFDNGLHHTQISRSREETPDPLNHRLVSARLGLDMLRAGEWALARAAKFSLPLLVMSGREDAVSDIDAAVAFASAAPDGTAQIWEKSYHELHTDDAREAVFAYLISWLRGRISSGEVAGNQPAPTNVCDNSL
ncbi:MAG: Phospholipase YtpA [bacterium ADurb.Bin429]|nr:MAG: Phospholipase YtpA [bacterium ADurb.Bin429]